MKLRIAFHSSKGERGIGKIIIAYTWALALVRGDWKSLKYDYSHVEIWWPDEDGDFDCGDRSKITANLNNIKIRFLGYCFSSTTRGPYDGVRIAPASEVLHNPHRWEYIEIEVDDDLWAIIEPVIETMDKQQIPYDFKGLFGFFWPWNIQDKTKYYCSELVSKICYNLKLTKKRHKRISPRRLARVLAKLYHEPKQL